MSDDYLDLIIKITKLDIQQTKRARWMAIIVGSCLLSLASVEIFSFHNHPDYWWDILNAGFQIGMAWSICGTNQFDLKHDLRNSKRLLRKLESLKCENLKGVNPFSLLIPDNKKPK